MNFSKISDKEIIFRIDKLAKTERKITHLILWHINELESRRLYAGLGFGSTFDYLVKRCGYSASSAMRRLQAARLLKQVPEFAEKIESGSLNLTQLSQVQSALKQERKDLFKTFGASNFDLKPKAQAILIKIENKSQKQTEMILAKEFDLPVKTEQKAQIQKDESLGLELTFSKDQVEVLEKAKALLSHQNPEGRWADLFVLLAQKELKKRIGKVEESEILQTSEDNNNGMKKDSDLQHKAAPERQLNSKKLQAYKRKYISIHLKRKLIKNANFQCEYVNTETGTRCSSNHFLEIEHNIPVSKGGTDHLQNLRIFCRQHNTLSAQQWGVDKPFGKQLG